MPAPHNTLKAALAAKTVQMGLWMNLVSPIAAEALSGAGFDWLLIDGEHGPNDIPTILAQVQAIGSRTSVVVRPPVGEVRMIKQLLDLGVQTILVPMIESADHAAQMVKAMHYPPVGMRGVGATIARASDYGRITDYITTANDQTCLILQIESRAGLAALPEILKLDGVDGVFIGPADLAADMGYPGNAAAPEVQATIDSTLAAIMASGKSAGILTFDAKAAQRYAAMGVTFLGIGSDVAVLVKAMTATLQAARAE
jgi:4-hydroxy-2-oxoheptanedioate aldolase